jgi:hypothetical protein
LTNSQPFLPSVRRRCALDPDQSYGVIDQRAELARTRGGMTGFEDEPSIQLIEA